MLHARLAGAGDAELVAHAERVDRHRVLLGRRLANRVGETADHAVLLGGDGDAGLGQRLDTGLGGERLDDRDVDDLGLDAVLAVQRSAASRARQTMWPQPTD